MENGLGGSHSPHLNNYVSLTSKPSVVSSNNQSSTKMVQKEAKREYLSLTLDSPGGGESLEFGGWIPNSQATGLEIIDAIRLTIQHINELSQYMLSQNTCRLADLDPKE